MESFKWGPQFLTGFDNVDDQHKKLVELINRFSTLLASNEVQYENVTLVFDELAAYAKYHFEDEEKLMMEMKVDPRCIDKQISEHKSFLADVAAMYNQITPDKLGKAKSLHEFLFYWLAYHILESDQDMARQIKAIDAGLSPEKAYLAEKRSASASTESLLSALNGLFLLVSERNKELDELNQSLEQKVVERTRKLKEANKQLEIIALTDVLTELPNRRYAMHHLNKLWDEAIRDNTSLACMMIDADGFKTVNDTYGHDAGDIVLQKLARELTHSVRNDDFVCRLGGDEFLIICPNTSLKGILSIAEQTRKNVADLRVPTGNDFWQGSISIGVAVSAKETNNVDELLKEADDGVYIAKKEGRNCVRVG